MEIFWILCAVLVAGVIMLIWAWWHADSFTIPMSAFLYTTSPGPRPNFYSQSQLEQIFPGSYALEAVWEQIRDEGYRLYQSLEQPEVNYLNNYNFSLGLEDKQHWTTLPLRLFKQENAKYMEQCPVTSEILNHHPEILSCIFSIMQPGKIIQPHIGPYDGILRYQLALDIPPSNQICSNNDDHHSTLSNECDPTFSTECHISPLPPTLIISSNDQPSLPDSNPSNGHPTSSQSIPSNECYLTVGDETYYWINGHGILFDETKLHSAINTTPHPRMVLMVDIERPYRSPLHQLLNKAIIFGIGSLPATKRATFM